MNEWQPISIPPKHRTPVLVYLPNKPSHYDGKIVFSVGVLTDRGWWLSAGGGAGGLCDEKEWQPTHWMPLPDPPTEPLVKG